jgi:hypothetical protein
MEELIDLIATDGSAADVSDRIKDLLYSKAAERVDSARPYVATSMFGDDSESEGEFEIDDEDTEEYGDEDYNEDQE